MRNSFLPPLPSSSQLFGFGNNEYRMPQDNMDSYSMLDCKINVHTNCFLSLPKLFNDADFEKGIFGFHSQPIGDPQIAGYDRYESSSNNSSDIIDRNHQSSLLTMTHNSFFPHSTPAVHREKKRPLTLETEEESMKADNEKIKRRKPISSYAKQFHMSTPLDQLNDNQVKQVPVRRSQKIGDRITALQKLVSPYGKTDTASVLYEASLYIKILHAQIQVQETLLITFFFLFKKLYQMLPYGNGNGNGNGNGSSISMIRSLKAKQESGGKLPMDLRSRGQCLVPISSIREVTKDNKA